MKEFNEGNTTDLRGYAIRISQGQVYYFGSDSLLKSCSFEEAIMMELKDLYRRSVAGPLELRRSFTISGRSNKNAFKSAAVKMRVGNTIDEFCSAALIECERQSSKPHKEVLAPENYRFILDVFPPKVYRKKKYTRFVVKFIINPTSQHGKSSVELAMTEIETFVEKAKTQLYDLDEFKNVPFEELPALYGIRIVPLEVVVEFQA